MKALTVIRHEITEAGLTQVQRLLQHRVEDRREIARRGVDDAKHFGGGSLLLQRIPSFGNEPSVLHSDDGLRREVFQQRDLPLGERTRLLAVSGNDPYERTLFPQ